jgi:hypothetical protein
MKRNKGTPPEESLALDAIAGDICALYDLKSHYDRLMRYALNMTIRKAAEDFGLKRKCMTLRIFWETYALCLITQSWILK